jgi:hypothetical protein
MKKMKKTLFNTSFLILALAFNLTSCLKDVGYENGKYGAIRNTEGKEYVSIPVAARNPNSLGLESKAGVQNIKLFAVSYDYVDPAAADISATVTVNNTLLTDPAVIPLPTAAYTLPSNSITIKAGSRASSQFILALNTSTLDPTKKYGIGFSLTAVSKTGVVIPANLKNAVYVFSLKNKFDGVYKLSFSMAPATDRDQGWKGPYTYPNDIQLITTGPNSVVMFNTAYAAGDNHPLMTPGVSGFGSTRPLFTFDENNKLISVTNDFPNPANGRAFALNPAVTTSRYDPATKTIYAAFIMNQPGFQPLPIYDTIKFSKARP